MPFSSIPGPTRTAAAKPCVRAVAHLMLLMRLGALRQRDARAGHGGKGRQNCHFPHDVLSISGVSLGSDFRSDPRAWSYPGVGTGSGSCYELQRTCTNGVAGSKWRVSVR